MQISNKYNRFLGIAILSIASSILFCGCPTIPEFPNEPSISYEDVTFRIISDTTDEGAVFSTGQIDLSLNFEDGDGDLGLASDENNPPFHPFVFPLTDDDNLIRFGESDTLPPYSPIDYLIPLKDDTIVVSYTKFAGTDSSQFVNLLLTENDTVYIQLNPRRNNIFVDFYYKPTNNSDFVLLDFKGPPYYQSFDGRFPPLNTAEYDRPINGTLTYSLKSVSFELLFREQPIMLEFYILDRAGNKSNVAQTNPFVLSQVKTEGSD